MTNTYVKNKPIDIKDLNILNAYSVGVTEAAKNTYILIDSWRDYKSSVVKHAKDSPLLKAQ